MVSYFFLFKIFSNASNAGLLCLGSIYVYLESKLTLSKRNSVAYLLNNINATKDSILFVFTRNLN